MPIKSKSTLRNTRSNVWGLHTSHYSLTFRLPHLIRQIAGSHNILVFGSNRTERKSSATNQPVLLNKSKICIQCGLHSYIPNTDNIYACPASVQVSEIGNFSLPTNLNLH